MATNDDKTSQNARQESYRKENQKKNQKTPGADPRPTLTNVPIDPNSPLSKGSFPPGIKPEDALDPGRQTPGAPPVDNRSGEES